MKIKKLEIYQKNSLRILNNGGEFLSGKIKFLQIYDVIKNAMNVRAVVKNPTLEILLDEDKIVRNLSEKFIENIA